jgi:hypothetical protein
MFSNLMVSVTLANLVTVARIADALNFNVSN